MAKVKNWLFSMDAKGHLGHQLTGQGSLGGQRVQPYRKPGGKASERQQAIKDSWKLGLSFWRKPNPDYPQEWQVWKKSLSDLRMRTTPVGAFMTQWSFWYPHGLNEEPWETSRIVAVTDKGEFPIDFRMQNDIPFFPTYCFVDWDWEEWEPEEIDICVMGWPLDEHRYAYIDNIAKKADLGNWKYCKVYAKIGNSEERLILPLCYNTPRPQTRQAKTSSNWRKPQPQHTTKEGK